MWLAWERACNTSIGSEIFPFLLDIVMSTCNAWSCRTILWTKEWVTQEKTDSLNLTKQNNGRKPSPWTNKLTSLRANLKILMWDNKSFLLILMVLGFLVLGTKKLKVGTQLSTLYVQLLHWGKYKASMIVVSLHRSCFGWLLAIFFKMFKIKNFLYSVYSHWSLLFLALGILIWQIQL